MKVTRLFIFLTMLALAACGQFNVSVEPISTTAPTITAVIPTMTAAIPTATLTATTLPTEQIDPTATLQIPSPTLTLPSATAVQQVTPATMAPTTATEQTVKIVLIALEDNGQSGTLVGCGDSAIPVTVTIPRTQGVLRAALEKLLSAKKISRMRGKCTFECTW